MPDQFDKTFQNEEKRSAIHFFNGKCHYLLSAYLCESKHRSVYLLLSCPSYYGLTACYDQKSIAGRCTNLGKMFTSLEENINSYIVSRNPAVTQKDNSSSSVRGPQVAASHMDTIFGAGWITGNVNFF